MRKAILGALVFSVFTAAQASAVTIDFTSSLWNPGSGDDDHTVGNVTVEADGPGNEALVWSSTNGFGINSDGNDSNQIEEDENLEITFAQLFSLTSFSLTELGNSEDGYYRYRNGGSSWSSWIKFDGTSSGNKTVLVSPTLVTALQFGFPDWFDENDRFYVKNLVGDYQQTQNPPSVPEPTSMVLLGTGLAGLVARARRKRA
jgi:hypothetical protein